MMDCYIWISIILFLQIISLTHSQRKEAKAFLDDYNKNFPKFQNIKYKAMFNRAINITPETINLEKAANDRYRIELTKVRNKARTFNLSDSDEDTIRQFKMLLKTKESTNSKTAKVVEDLASEMKQIWSTTLIPYTFKGMNKTMSIGQVISITSTSKDPDELLYVWKTWRKVIAKRLRKKYETYVRLNNIGALENGFSDAGAYHRSSYDVPDLKSIVDEFLKDLQPFYQELHGFIRYHLRSMYPKLIDAEGLIPAHLVGNIWAQSWESLYSRVVPYPNEPTLDVTPVLKKKKSIPGMLEMAEEFFTSLGWRKLPQSFWDNSVFVKPKDPNRKLECYPSAMDLKGYINGEPDVRIKMCMEKTQRDFITIHHEIGHIYYDLFYWDQPLQYRDGANPGFHEAVGDVVTLSMQTPVHLNNVGLLNEISQTKEADINFLLKTALEQISFLPFAFVMDQWMWNVYSGDIKSSEYNEKWWQYREKYQGIKNPVKSGKDDFDAAAKFHIPGDVPYIRYFFASILMFTFHKRACDLSNNTRPLHQCSIYQSKEAGKAFRDMLALGRSKKWPVALKQFTGSEKISSDPVKEYFAPLIVWLKEYRKKHKYKIGWSGNEAMDDKNTKTVPTAATLPKTNSKGDGKDKTLDKETLVISSSTYLTPFRSFYLLLTCLVILTIAW